MSTKQLYEKTSEGMKEVNPLVAIEDIYSKLSDTPLEALVSLYNHVKCEWKGSVADTRRTVPLFLRRSGLFITYNNGTKYVTEFFSGGTNQITTEGWIKDSNWTPVPDEDYISAGVKPGIGSIGYEQLNNNLKQLFREKVNVTNYPDDEDIVSVDNMLKLKDREADAANFQSKGYVILRKNLRLINGVVKNILTQDMINQPNTIYEIRYDFDLNGTALEMPDNCTLKFAGGMLKNGIICSNFTKFQGSPLLRDINIKYNIFDRFDNQISKKTYKEIRKDINVIFPLVGWDEESARLVCQNANSAQIENIQIIYYTSYDVSSNSISTPDLSFLSRGIKAIVDYIQKYRLKIYSIKFHKNSGYNDTPSLAEKNAYREYVKNIVSEYLKYTDTIKTVFISNEEPNRTDVGNNWNEVHLDLINWLHEQKIKVGISDLNVTQIINMDNNLYENIDYPGLNFYPSLSFYDLDTNESHIPNMIENCSSLLKVYVDSVRKKGGLKYLSITESGVVCRDKALRRPYAFDESLGERNNTGIIPYLYHKTLLNSCIKTGIFEYYAWYLETEDFNKPIVNDFFDCFMFK